MPCRLLWKAAAVFLASAAALWGATSPVVLHASAEEGTPAKARLAPDGIDGALVLCGDGPSDAAVNEFFELAGREARLVVVASSVKEDLDTAEKLAGAFKARKPASVEALHEDVKDAKLIESFRWADGVWLIDSSGTRLGDVFRDTDAGKALRALLRRGGVVGASGAAAAALAALSVADKLDGGERAGLGLLPGVVFDARFHTGKDEDRMFAALDRNAGRLGVGLGDGAALVVQGRRVLVAGGVVTVCLARSAARPRRTIELTAKTRSDFTMLRRAALARAAPPFPPKEPAAPEVPKGSLVIVGGGGMPGDVTAKFIELAGGPDANIVVLPTANPDGPADTEGGFLRRAGAKNVVALPARKIEEVEDPKNLEVLKKADAVWFGGGRQWRFVDAYEGTKAYDLYHEVLRRGGVIGGSSAGATIQGDYLSRGSPLGNTEMMCEGYERGFGFLPGTVIDQHFRQRDRFADMTALMQTYPQLLGIGLDEATALVVKGHEAEVMGKGEAHFYDRNKPAAEDKPDYESLKAGGRYDLKARKVLEAASGGRQPPDASPKSGG